MRNQPHFRRGYTYSAAEDYLGVELASAKEDWCIIVVCNWCIVSCFVIPSSTRTPILTQNDPFT